MKVSMQSRHTCLVWILAVNPLVAVSLAASSRIAFAASGANLGAPAGGTVTDVGGDGSSSAGAAFCSTTFQRKTYKVGPGETQRGDRYFAGVDADIEGTLDGDFIACAQGASVRGAVTEDVNVLAKKLVIMGLVGDDVRFLTGDTDISGRINGDLLGMSQNLEVRSGSEVDGRTLVGGERVILSGDFKGPVQATGGEILFGGHAEGDVKLVADTLSFEPGAKIDGDLNYSARDELDIFRGNAAEGKKIVAGAVTFVPKSTKARQSRGFFHRPRYLAWSFAAAFVLGCLLIATARGPATTIAESVVHETLKTLGYGVLGHVLAPLTGVILICLCLTLPIGVLLLLAWAVLFYLAKLVVSLALADGVLTKVGYKASPFLALFLGMIPVWILFQIPILGKFLSWFVVPVVGIGGLLAGVQTYIARRKTASTPDEALQATA